MLNHIMLATLDTETQREWELHTSSRADTPTIAELITFLESRCRALELLQNTQSLYIATANPRSTRSVRGKVSKPLYSNVATQIQCTMCNGSHRLFKCDTFVKLQPRQRLNYARQQRLCLNCLQTFFKNHTFSKRVCRKCNKRHHTLIHTDTQNQANRDSGSTTNNDLSANTKGATVAEVNAYHTLKGKTRNHVLLATAIVEVRNKSGQYIPCRALLDSGSQSHFITERCVQRLRLPRTQTHTSIQGISNVNTATHHSVSVHLRSRHTDWHTTLDCAILSNITGTTLPTRLDTSSWKIPTDIILVDEQFNQPGDIDLLIGVDLFYEISRPGRRTRPGNFPVLQETVLGWTTAGRTSPNTTVEGVKRAFLQRETSKMEYIIKHFWDLEPVKQSTRIVKHQAWEEHLHTHTTQ